MTAFDNIVSAYLGMLALMSLIGAAILFVKGIRLFNGSRALGTVVGHAQRMRDRRPGRIHYMPIVRFVPPSGSPIEVQSRFGGTEPGHLPVGSVVPILYDPTNPQGAEIATSARLWAAPSAFVLMSAALFIGSIKASG